MNRVSSRPVGVAREPWQWWKRGIFLVGEWAGELGTEGASVDVLVGCPGGAPVIGRATRRWAVARIAVRSLRVDREGSIV